MSDQSITAPADHPEFAELRRMAGEMIAEAMAIADGSSAPGAERHQAFYYAANALVNEAAFPRVENVAEALGMVLGAIGCEVDAEHLGAFLEIAVEQAAHVVQSRRAGSGIPPRPRLAS